MRAAKPCCCVLGLKRGMLLRIEIIPFNCRVRLADAFETTCHLTEPFF